MDSTIFDSINKPVIGVIHLLPLPGTPLFSGNLEEIYQRAQEEVSRFKSGGVDGIIIENFHDNPFSNHDISKVQLAIMASVITNARKEIDIPIGVNVHFNDWEAEIALAYACKAQFVRIEAFVDTVMTPSGIVEACCAEVTRFRKLIQTENTISIWADIHPKYSTLLINNSIEESGIMAQNALADAIIITGETTGIETPIDDLQRVKSAVKVPILAGSGTTIENVTKVLSVADGVIVGSTFKSEGNINNLVSVERVGNFMEVVKSNFR
jgi:hypothetical protein